MVSCSARTLDPLPGADLAGRDGVEGGLEADQAVAPDPAPEPRRDHVGMGGRRGERGPVGGSADREVPLIPWGLDLW